MLPVVGTLKAEYERLSADRNPYLQRARDASKYTIPFLIPPAGSTGSTKLKNGFTSYGARCVNSLASKLTLALFPPKSPFFKIDLEAKAKAQLEGTVKADGTPLTDADIDEALAAGEQRLVDQIEQTNSRPQGKELTRHLIIGGNALVRMKPEGGLDVHGLPSFVVKRSPSGQVLSIILCEPISPAEVPEGIRDEAKVKAGNGKRNSGENSLELLTGIFFEAGRWYEWQEVSGIKVPESEGDYPADRCPYIALRWTVVQGEDYGRGMVEEYLGDLISLEGLSAALVKGSAAMAKLIFLRNPNGTTKATAITRAETGAVVDGNAADVTVLESQKARDFAMVRQTVQDIKSDLAYAFLLNTAIQRDAERVTAEEIRFMANELDSSLGGVYTTLATEFQLPFVRLLLAKAMQDRLFPTLPPKTLKPVIITGIEALGRGAELENLRAYVKDVVELGGPEALQTALNFDELMKRLATARGIKPKGLVKTADEKAQAEQQAQMQNMVQTLGPQAIQQAGGMAQQAMKPQGT